MDAMPFIGPRPRAEINHLGRRTEVHMLSFPEAHETYIGRSYQWQPVTDWASWAIVYVALG